MFDIGFWEIVVIAIVGLLVVGPDKFPGMIRETARWVVKIRRFIVDTKREIEREINFEDIENDLTGRIAELEKTAEHAPDKKPAPDRNPVPDKKPETTGSSDQGAVDKQAPA